MIQVGRNLKNVGKRPKCPSCKAPNPVSRGVYWLCRKCGRNWLKFYRGVSKKKLVRPDCKHCGADGEKYIVSFGLNWFCNKCGRRFTKKILSRRLDLGKRPNCPECGAPNPYSSALSWICTECGRSWFKNPRTVSNFSILELHKAPVHEI